MSVVVLLLDESSQMLDQNPEEFFPLLLMFNARLSAGFDRFPVGPFLIPHVAGIVGHL